MSKQEQSIGMLPPEVQRLLPHFNQTGVGVGARADTAEAQLRVMAAEHEVRSVLGVPQDKLDAALRRIAVFHATASPLGVYQASLLGVDTRTGREGIVVYAAADADQPKFSMQFVKDAIALKHGPLRRSNIPGVEARILDSLVDELTRVNTGSGLEIKASVFPGEALDPAYMQPRQERVFNKLSPSGHLRFFGELFPDRAHSPSRLAPLSQTA